MYNAENGDRIRSEIGADMRPPPRNRRRCTAYPPPIPWLARAENRPSNMPWVMKRYYSGDGRLVITEERVRHHEYLQVHRSNGRLVLNLVPLNDAVEEGQVEEEVIGNNGDEIDGGDEGTRDPTVGELVPRCYAYNYSLGVNACAGFAAVVPPAFRPPVHT